MSKPYGYYMDPILDRAHRSTPRQDWVGVTACVFVLSAFVGWMIPMIVLSVTLWHGWDGNEGFWWRYLVCIGVWVVPCSVWTAVAISRDRSREEAT